MMVQHSEGVFRCATSALVYPRTVGVGVGVGVGGGVGVGEATGMGVTATVAVGLGVGVTTGVGETTGVWVTTGVGVGEILGAGVTVGAALITTPLLQTRLLPFFKQVNSRFLEITTVPTFLHAVPARGVFAEALLREINIKENERTKTNTRRISGV